MVMVSRLFGISRKTFYTYRQQAAQGSLASCDCTPRVHGSAKPQRIIEAVLHAKAQYPSFGKQRLANVLYHQGIVISPNTVQRILRRSYWIPGSYAPTLSENHDSFLRLLKNKGFKEEKMTQVGLYAIGTSTTLESNKSLSGNLLDFFDSFSVRFLQGQESQNATHGDRDSSLGDPPNARAGDPTDPSPAARRPPRWLSTATRPIRPN
jgi:hypothetical protein